MIDKSVICKRYLEKIGQEVCIVRADGSEERFFAAVQQTWRKNKTRFEDSSTIIGRVYNDYYMYIGPADVDITVLGENDYLVCNSSKYIFVRSEKVFISSKIQFCTGMLKKIREDKDSVFE